MSDAPVVLGPRAARVLYNVADAWCAPPSAADGAPDPVVALAPALRDDAALRGIERVLWWVEWSPRLALRSWRGFSWLGREERRAWLARLEAGRSRRVRDALRALRGYLAPGA